MKKILTMLLTLCLVFSVVSCNGTTDNEFDPNLKSEGVATHAEFIAAAADADIVIEGFVQAKQGWWGDEAVVYLQDGTGGYYIYKLPCTEAEFDSLTVGTKIQVTGKKAIYNGMHEIMNVTDWKVIESDAYVATAVDITTKLSDDAALVNYLGALVKMTDMTVASVTYKNDEPGDDIYLSLTKGDATYNLTVEVYLTGVDSDVYTAVGELAVGDVVDVEGYLQWWNKFDCHVSKITKK